MPFLSKKKLSLRVYSNESFLFINSAIKFMYEQMVLGVANVGSKKNRIVVILIISFMISMVALLLPVQTYAAGEALSVLVGALAGYIAESTIGASLVAAGVGALIPEFAAALVAVAIGLGVSITVYNLFQCVEAWWGASGSVSAVEMIANSWDKTKQRVVATPYVFATMVELIKSKILGIKTAADVGSSFPTFENMQHIGSVTWNTDETFTSYTFDYFGSEITSVYKLQWISSSFSILHYSDISSGNIGVRVEAPVRTDKPFNAGTWTEKPFSPISVEHYTPVLTSDVAQLATVAHQTWQNKDYDISEISNCNIPYVYYTSNDSVTKVPVSYDSTSKHVIINEFTGSRWRALRIGGEIVETFESQAEFAYKFLYKASEILTVDRYDGVIASISLSSGASIPVSAPDISKNYSKSRDVISTTADSIGAKVASGEVTKETAGSIAIPLIPSAAGELKTTTADIADVKITDVAIPGQIEADDTAKQEADIDPPGNIGAAFRQGGDLILDGAMTIGEKFPFDVIKCAYEWLECLVQPGKPIVINFAFDLPVAGKVPVKFDFSERQDVVDIINWLCIVSTGIGLVLASRQWLLSI